MEELYNKLEKYCLKDAIEFEQKDRQFVALEKLWDKTYPSVPTSSGITMSLPFPGEGSIETPPSVPPLPGEGSMKTPPSVPPLPGEGSMKELYLFLIIANALVCYQLSGKGEDYWEEFSEYLITHPPRFLSTKLAPATARVSLENGRSIYTVLEFFNDFLINSKNNKRFTRIKMKRIEKILPFWEDFVGKREYYYENMSILRDDLSIIMNQRKDAKTIVFAVKMFSYGARTCYNEIIYFPEDINIPIDSRLIKIFEKYNGGYLDINDFYFDLSRKLKIPQLHLDAILWNSNDLI